MERVMTRIIAVALETIACTNNGFGGTVQISGNSVGSTFKNVNFTELRDTRVIFSFPAGPISITEGETKWITMDHVRFSLRTQHDPQDHTRVFRLVSDLNNGLGSNAFVIGWEDPLPFAPSTSVPPDDPKRFGLDYTTANLAITLTFIAYTVQVF
jgi:hypothetical protein